MRADRLHCPYDILIGESRCLSPFRLSGEEDEIVHGDDALEHSVFIHDREPSDFSRFMMSMAVWTSSVSWQVWAFPDTVSQTVMSDAGLFFVAVAMQMSRSVIMLITWP